MNSKSTEKGNKNLKTLIAGASIIILISAFILIKNNGAITGNAANFPKNTISGQYSGRVSFSELQKEVYPKFICSCCGNTIDQCTCGMAEGMKEQISLLADKGLTKEEIILEATKKFGLSSLADDSLREYVQEKLVENAPSDRPVISIEPSVYDFGTISQSKGVIYALFDIRNDGNSDLVINSMDTSCMCTTASIINNGEEGPVFGMSDHGDNPKSWSTTIKPGKTAKLKVYYDPDAHGKFTGLVTRTISIFSNDPIDFQKQVRIELNQAE